MKKAVSLLLIVCLAITLLTGCSGNANPPAAEQPTAQETGASQTDAAQNDAAESAPAAKKTMVIGDTTFNSENWEETVDPHRTYNGWACIRYGIGYDSFRSTAHGSPGCEGSQREDRIGSEDYHGDLDSLRCGTFCTGEAGDQSAVHK